jgi:hypothetical protein
MGQAANDAMISVSGLDVLLAVASSPNVSREQRFAAGVRAAQQYRQLVRVWTAFEAAAPNVVSAGYEAHQRAMDFKEMAT